MGEDDEAGGALPSPSRRSAAGPSLSPNGRGDAAPKPLRARHDGFTPRKQRKFFKALRKSGCIADACRAAGISRNTVRRHRGKWPGFEARVEAALAIASVELDMIAWQRATQGAEEKVWRDGKLAMTRIKPSDAMLRLLMQGANPKKYGRTGQMPRAAVMKELRRQAMEEARAKLDAGAERAKESILRKLQAIERHRRAEKLAKGYSEGPEGLLIPPGWRMIRDGPALPEPEDRG